MTLVGEDRKQIEFAEMSPKVRTEKKDGIFRNVKVEVTTEKRWNFQEYQYEGEDGKAMEF